MKSDIYFWQALLNKIAEGKVVPIIGPDAVFVSPPNGQQPWRFVDRVGELLTAELKGVEAKPVESCPTCGRPHSPGYGSPKVDIDSLLCCAARAQQYCTDGDPDTFGWEHVLPIAKRLEEEVVRDDCLPEPLRQLAEIPEFDLYVTTTFDRLLERALEEKVTHLTSFSRAPSYPNAKELLKVEITREARKKNKRNDTAFLLYLFGRAIDLTEKFAFAEAQFLHQMHEFISTDNQTLVDLLATRDLLFIGVAFPDWLTRFLIKAARGPTPLWDRKLAVGTKARTTYEFIVNSKPVPGGFDTFVELFMQNRALRLEQSMTCAQFIAELHRRWFHEHPEPRPPRPRPESLPPVSTPSVFISYSHEADTDPNHIARVIQFVTDLRACGKVDIFIDWEAEEQAFGVPGKGSWYDWAREKIGRCNKRLVIASSTYWEVWWKKRDAGAGKGAASEIVELRMEIDENRSDLTPRIRMVTLKEGDAENAPAPLRGKEIRLWEADRAERLNQLFQWLHTSSSPEAESHAP